MTSKYKDGLVNTSSCSIRSHASRQNRPPQQKKKKIIDMIEICLIFFVFVVAIRATNFLILLWNSILSAMAQLIRFISLMIQPVPDCIKFKKRTVFGSLLQLLFSIILFVTYNTKKIEQQHQINFFLGVNIIIMEAIFMFRMGEGFHEMIFDNPDLSLCQVSEQQVMAFVAPYWVLVILRCSVYYTIAKTVYKNFKREDRSFVCNLQEFFGDVYNILKGEHDFNDNQNSQYAATSVQQLPQQFSTYVHDFNKENRDLNTLNGFETFVDALDDDKQRQELQITSKVSSDQELIWGFLETEEEQLQEQWFEQYNMHQEETKETNSISSEDPYINHVSLKKKII